MVRFPITILLIVWKELGDLVDQKPLHLRNPFVLMK
jgi:hypothetical protein